jgi:hypothetical protein
MGKPGTGPIRFRSHFPINAAIRSLVPRGRGAPAATTPRHRRASRAAAGSPGPECRPANRSMPVCPTKWCIAPTSAPRRRRRSRPPSSPEKCRSPPTPPTRSELRSPPASCAGRYRLSPNMGSSRGGDRPEPHLHCGVGATPGAELRSAVSEAGRQRRRGLLWIGSRSSPRVRRRGDCPRDHSTRR